MNTTPNYIAYVDLVGIGDASVEDNKSYHTHLSRFRRALCDAVDEHLVEPDKVFAFSDCAFASSPNLNRLGDYLQQLQKNLWEQREQAIFLKGAISEGKSEYNDFAFLEGQSRQLISNRRKKLHGYWFANEFVKPALLEKNLKGIAIQVDNSIKDTIWLKQNTLSSGYYPSESSKKPVVILDLLIPKRNLHSLDSLLKTYMMISHGSRRVSRYYVPLIVTWIKSFDYSAIKCDSKTGKWNNAPLPLCQLIQNPKIASEVIALVGGSIIFYALLAKVSEECTEEKVVTQTLNFISSSKKLREAAELIPNEICPKDIRLRVVNSRVQYLFSSTA